VLREYLYKIARPAEWAEAEKTGLFSGSADDRRDGYVHLSTAAQVRGTVARHFSTERSLLVIAISASDLLSAVRWEAAPGAEKFPHLYGVLPLAAVASVREIARGPDGAFAFPPEFP
jgi:uncharacterized protein (DUF952 family)